MLYWILWIPESQKLLIFHHYNSAIPRYADFHEWPRLSNSCGLTDRHIPFDPHIQPKIPKDHAKTSVPGPSSNSAHPSFHRVTTKISTPSAQQKQVVSDNKRCVQRRKMSWKKLQYAVSIPSFPNPFMLWRWTFHRPFFLQHQNYSFQIPPGLPNSHR